MATNNKKGQYKLHNIDAVKNKSIKNYLNIQIVAAQVRHCLASSMLSPQSLKPYKQSSISKIILHFHFALPILLDVVFYLFIKAQTLFPYIISKILILYSHKIFDILQPVLLIHILAKNITFFLHDLVALLTNLINLHLRLCLICGKLVILQSNLV